MIVSDSKEETHKFAAEISEKISKGGLLKLFGNLGSGKTEFTKGLAQSLGIEKFSIKSPTYTYIRTYPRKNNNFYHIDLYRIEESDELLLQEINEILSDPANIVVIEWAEKLKDIKHPAIEIHFEYLDEKRRKITLN